MVLVQGPTIRSEVTFFVTRNHFINLVRKPGRISIIQSCACGGYIGNCDGVGLINRTRTDHAVPGDANRVDLQTTRQGINVDLLGAFALLVVISLIVAAGGLVLLNMLSAPDLSRRPMEAAAVEPDHSRG
jgi:hypothetical protein